MCCMFRWKELSVDQSYIIYNVKKPLNQTLIDRDAQFNPEAPHFFLGPWL